MKLEVRREKFTLDGREAFLLGASYYGALGAPERFVKADLDDLKRLGFNWIRVWATWDAYGNDVSAVDRGGRPRRPFIDKLKWLVEEADRRGMVVDVTLSRGPLLPNFEAHRRAVEAIVKALGRLQNWYLDLANERNIRDARFVSLDEIRKLRDVAKKLKPDLPVTASHAGDMSREELRRYLFGAEVDFVCPHRPRHPGSPGQTAEMTKRYLRWMRELGRVVPVHYQEPFRRDFHPERWQPKAEDFLTDLLGAIEGGAAGWCFHNGGLKGRGRERARRCFDMRPRFGRLFDQLDEEERRALTMVHARLRGALTVHPFRPHCFCDPAGNPLILVGDYTWGIFSDVGYDYRKMFDTLKAHGLNLARVWLFWGLEEFPPPIYRKNIVPYLRTGPGRANDGRPKYDLTKFNPAFFRRLRDLCRAARERGIFLQLVLFDAWMIKHPHLWRLHAFHRDNNVNGADGDPGRTGKGTDGRRGFCSMGNPRVLELQKLYVRKVVEAVNEFENVYFEIANENYYSPDWERHLCQFVHEIERDMPKKHLAMPLDLPNHDFGTWKTWDLERLHRKLLYWRARLPQPLIFDTDGIGCPDDDTARRAFWTAVLSGGHVDYLDDSLQPGPEHKGDFTGSRRRTLRRQLGHLARFTREVPLWRMEPRPDLVEGGRAFVMASEGELAAYLPDGGELALDLSKFEATFDARWFDPRMGRWTEGGKVRGGAGRRFSPPGRGDWALCLRRTGP